MHEVNLDCLAGPTHHFGGLAFGNIASQASKGILSHPKKAAIQGLEKMKLLHDLGIPQIILPPHPRPCYDALRAVGFTGTNKELLEKAYRHNPTLLLQVCSSSAMWAANSATVTPSCDSSHGKVQITVSNLCSNLHRSLEVSYTEKILRAIFHNKNLFELHAPLPSVADFSDEGAANHIRIEHYEKGFHLFVHGKSYGSKTVPLLYPARQTKEAQEAIARLHGIKDPFFVQQNPKAIDAGVFHNDVISMGHEDLFIFHEEAFTPQDTQRLMDALQKREIKLVKITKEELSLEQAVRSYFFNSQIVTSNGKRILIAPMQCKGLSFLPHLGGIDKVLFVELDESMKNGGGPACLRLRVPLNDRELQSIHKGVILTPQLYGEVKNWIERNYLDELHMDDFLNSQFLEANERAQDEILELLKLPNIEPQRAK
jgi:succinylarginine dihydrolase